MEEVDASTGCWFTGRLAAWVRVNIGVRLEGMRGGFCLRLETVLLVLVGDSAVVVLERVRTGERSDGLRDILSRVAALTSAAIFERRWIGERSDALRGADGLDALGLTTVRSGPVWSEERLVVRPEAGGSVMATTGGAEAGGWLLPEVRPRLERLSGRLRRLYRLPGSFEDVGSDCLVRAAASASERTASDVGTAAPWRCLAESRSL